MLAGRSLGFFVGIWTLVATEVGGVFVNGTSEVMYTQGALWALAPIGYSIRYPTFKYFTDKNQIDGNVTHLNTRKNQMMAY